MRKERRGREEVAGPPHAAQWLCFRHSHGGTGCGSAHKPAFASRASDSSFSRAASPGAYFRQPPGPPLFDKRMIDVGAIRQEHICKSSPVLVLTVSLERDFLAKNQGRGGLLGLLAVGLALFRAVDTTEADAFRVLEGCRRRGPPWHRQWVDSGGS